MPQTTKKHYELFKKECTKWRKILGLNGWDIRCTHEDKLDDALACTVTDLQGRRADLYLSKEWDEPPTEIDVKKAAFHEIMEVFLSEIDTMAQTRTIVPAQLDSARHAIIRTLEHVLFPKY